MCQIFNFPLFSDPLLLFAQEDKLGVQERLIFTSQTTYDVTIFVKVFIKLDIIFSIFFVLHIGGCTITIAF